MRTTRLLCSFVLAAAALPAQVLSGGDLVVTDYASPGSVYRVDGNGVATPLWSGSPLQGPSGVTTTHDGDVVVADYPTSSLHRIRRQNGQISTIATGISGPIRVKQLQDGDFVVTSLPTRSVLRVTPAGVVTPIYTGAPLVRPFGMCIDSNGDVLLVDDNTRSLYRLTLQGVLTTIASGGGMRLPQGVALFPNGDYAVIDGLTDSVFRIDRGTGFVSTWVSTAALAANPEGIVPDTGGGFFISYSSSAGSGVRGVDALGNPTTVVAGAPLVNLEDVARVPVLHGPTALTTGPGSVFTYALEIPSAAFQFYTLILSDSVFPGWQLPLGDPRSLALNPDPFFFATIGVNAPPFLNNTSSFLDVLGRATATIDLSLLPPGVFAGTDFFLQGLTLANRFTAGATTDWLRLRLQ